ncbi:MATE family efflux transporter [Chloroflexota bacterium]
MKRTEFDRDWTKGNIFRNLLSLAWPMVLNEIFWVVGMFVDMVWVGRLGVASIAGVGVAGMVVMVLMSARWGLNTGTRAIIARFIGAGDTKGANHVAQQAFVISASYAIVVGSIGVIFAVPILSLFGLEADVVREGAAYMRVQFAGSVLMAFWIMAESIMQASGDAVTPMKVTIVARFTHLVLDPFLIFGWWIFPRFGVIGAATAGVVGYSVGMALGLWVLFSGRSRIQLSMRNFRLDPSIIWRIVRIGIPASLMSVQRSFGNLFLVQLTVPFGTLSVAAHTLYQRLEMVLRLPSMGLGMAAGVLVGQNLGARQPQRAEKSGWLAIGLVQGLMIICSGVILLWAERIVGLFSTEPALVEVASIFIRIAAAGYLVLGLNAVFQQSLAGAGDTVPVMIITLLMIWAVQLPLAFFLPKITNLGVLGIRWAIVAGLVVGAVNYILYFWLGRWKRKKV